MNNNNKQRSKIAIYNKERTKSKLIKAVGKILIKEGFQNIRINKIEKVAGVSKKAIYDYFGGIEGLTKAYLNQVDFWKANSNISSDTEDINFNIDDNYIFNLIKNDFDFFFKSKEMQKIVLWGISEKNKTIQCLTEEREKLGEKIFQKMDENCTNYRTDIRAIMAILVAAIYYMGLHTKNNGSTMCGINVANEEGKNRILNTIEHIVKFAFMTTPKK